MILVNYRGFIGPKEANDRFLFSNWIQVFKSKEMVKLGYNYVILSVWGQILIQRSIFCVVSVLIFDKK